MFSKLFLSIAVMVALCFSQSNPNPTTYDLIQPDRHIHLDSSMFNASSHIDTIKLTSGQKAPCKGLWIRCGVTTLNNVVEVHLVNDPPGTFVLYPIYQACIPTGAIFDMVRATNTSVNLDSIEVCPK